MNATPKLTKSYASSLFSTLIRLVEQGNTITQSCRKLGYKTSFFYKHLNTEQKRELISSKISCCAGFQPNKEDWKQFRESFETIEN